MKTHATRGQRPANRRCDYDHERYRRKEETKEARRAAPEASPDSPVVSYTPEQRRMIRNGLRIWARVAIRSYMRKHGAGSLPEAAPDGGEEDGQ